MHIFHLRDRLIQEYAAYTSSFVQIRDQQIKAYVDQCLAAGMLWPESLIQLNPSFEPGEWIDELVYAGVLHLECSRIFHKDKQKYGEYRTKRVILEISDAMAEAICTRKPYRTLLDPPPAAPALPTRRGRRPQCEYEGRRMMSELWPIRSESVRTLWCLF